MTSNRKACGVWAIRKVARSGVASTFPVAPTCLIVSVTATVGTAAPAVTEPTPATTAPAPVPAPVVRTVPAGDGLFVYPRQKQSDLKAADDRHACDLWAQQQTGYDFERPGQSNPDLFDNFQRAVIACLDARGYSAR